MLWPFDPLSDYVVFIFYPLLALGLQFAHFFNFFFYFWHFFDAWIEAKQNTVSTSTL